MSSLTGMVRYASGVLRGLAKVETNSRPLVKIGNTTLGEFNDD